mmetsp:Transcript_1174/g.3395  ORF Transcript_1174/g.3395 Transcript_1174/m.3395 type:complete len:91 (+) Transcript_1174:26-298(+)
MTEAPASSSARTWDKFYERYGVKFYKDRHWLRREVTELMPVRPPLLSRTHPSRQPCEGIRGGGVRRCKPTATPCRTCRRATRSSRAASWD